MESAFAVPVNTGMAYPLLASLSPLDCYSQGQIPSFWPAAI